MAKEINAWVGREIKAWREARGWTRYQLSKHSSVQEISIKRIEEGAGLRLDTLNKLLDAMGLELGINRKPEP
jgi:transcriptional regulator with XRE-family HTH domain